MALVLRFFVVIFGFYAASLAAAATLTFGTLADFADQVGAADATLFSVVVLTTSILIAFFAFIPALIVILMAESFAWRSVLLYALAGGALGAGFGLGFGELFPEPGRGRSTELMAAAGIVGGLVYWLIAGRNAGMWSHSRPELSR
jgi:hypothetical protein